jgi:Bacterial transglutaminase-like N-terminal region
LECIRSTRPARAPNSSEGLLAHPTTLLFPANSIDFAAVDIYSFDQRLLHSHLSILRQPVRLRWIHDVFGNCVALFDFDTSSTYLAIESLIRHHLVTGMSSVSERYVQAR